MTNLYSRLEIDDENGDNYVISDLDENKGFTCRRTRFSNSSLVYRVRNIGSIKSKIRNNKQVRAYLDCISQSNLVAMYHFDGDATDSGPNKHNGTLVNSPTFTAGWFDDDALQTARASNQYVQVTDHADFSLGESAGNSVTWVFTFKLTASAGATQVLGRFGTTSAKILPYIHSSLGIRCDVRTADNSVTFYNAGVGTISLDTWYMLFYTFDADTQTFRAHIYNLQTGEFTSGTNTALGQYLHAGAGDHTLAGDGSLGYDGVTDEIRIYSRLLSTEEMQTLAASYIQHKLVFTGVQIAIDEIGITAEQLQVTCRELFKDAQLSNDVHKKYADQEIATTVTDIINRLNTLRGYGFDTSEIATLDQTLPFNFITENLEHAITRITNSSFSELFMRPNKHIVLRKRQIINSYVTFTDDMIRNPDSIQVTKSIADAYEFIRLAGGLSTEAYDTDTRILVEARVPNAGDEIAGRVLSLIDERFTTFYGAKSHVLTLLSDYGQEFYAFTQPLACHDLTTLPEPGELVTINSTKKSINENFVLEGYEFTQRVGMASVNEVSFSIGKTEQGELETLYILQQIAEDEKRKSIDVDTATDQKFASFAVKHEHTLTLTITKRDRTTTPYKWGDGSGAISGNEFKWSFGAWHDGS